MFVCFFVFFCFYVPSELHKFLFFMSAPEFILNKVDYPSSGLDHTAQMKSLSLVLFDLFSEFPGSQLGKHVRL